MPAGGPNSAPPVTHDASDASFPPFLTPASSSAPPVSQRMALDEPQDEVGRSRRATFDKILTEFRNETLA